MEWTKEAQQYIKRVPPFVREMAKRGVEAHARKQGADTITDDLLAQYKAKALSGKRGDHSSSATAPEARINEGEVDRPTTGLAGKNEEWFWANEGVDPLCHAFARKMAVHAGASGEFLAEEKVLSTWKEVAGRPDLSPMRTVYIHIPFCQNHCLYCGFYRYPVRAEDSARYTDALLNELKLISGDASVASHPIHAVYLGGGTPTDLVAADLKRLLSGIARMLPLSNDCEITVEGRLLGFTDEKMEACIEGGASRFSFGVQSFDTQVRRQMGRVLDRQGTIDALNRVCDLDQGPVAIDLIYGLPGQTPVIWEEDVRTLIEETAVDGVSLYQLNVFSGSPLSTAIEAGRLASPADIPLQARMFATGREMLAAARFNRLSASHWGRTAKDRSRYNRFIRHGGVCIPLGCGAGGLLHGYRFFQEGELKEYYARLAAGEKPVATAIRLSEEAPLFHALVGGIDAGALNLTLLSDLHGCDLNRLLDPLLTQWERSGLIERTDDGWIELSVAGEFWHVNLAQGVIDYYSKCSTKEQQCVR